MSVLIKGMKMPKCCDVCTFGEWSNLHQTACCKLLEYEACFKDYSQEYKMARSERCPLVEIPPHGRLIDADAFAEFIKDAIKRLDYESLNICELLTVADVLNSVVSELEGTGIEGFKNTPTVIEAEEE